MTRSGWLALLFLIAAVLGHAKAASLTLEKGRPFTQSGFEQLIEDALPPSQPGQRLALRTLTPSLPMNNSTNQPVLLDLADLQIDRARGRFEAELVVQAEGGRRNPLKLVGSVTTEVEVISLTAPVAAGSSIDPSDASITWIAEGRLPEDALRDPSQLKGMEAARRLPAGKPLREGDIRPASLVRRNDVVDIVYHSNGMEISLLGRSLSDGSSDAMVRVINGDTGKELQARVIGQKQVEVKGMTR
ncbi:flagellar basal body P-ring formation chaperone FlgA [Arboricoccus pini]|nr:flagellar basal body P-ring formation chaperone FlgA [Arboricoccus pini]